MKNFNDKIFLTINEANKVFGLGAKTLRTLVKKCENKEIEVNFVLKIGNRSYIDKERFLDVLRLCEDNNISLM